jgi:hypothetical protein
MRKVLLGLILFIFFLASCSEQQGSPEQALREVGGDLKNSHLRGVSIGNSKDEVKSKEKKSPTEETESNLLYRNYTSNIDSSYYEINYNFDELGLFEIQTDVFLQSAENSKAFFELLKNKFNDKYGSPTGEGEIISWSSKTDKGTALEVTISHEGIEYIKPFISINFIEPLEEGGGN